MSDGGSSGCVFCAIVAREVPSSVVCEDDATIAFMDLGQFNPGHTLVVPKAHVPDIFALDDACSTAVMRTLVRVARAVRASFTPDGVNVMQSNGAAAGQEVFHLHFHVVPRTEGDGMLHYYPAARSPVPRSDLDKQAALIAGHL